MIKLIHLLKEIINNPKAIIMAGSAGSGKTFFYNKIKNGIRIKSGIKIKVKLTSKQTYAPKKSPKV